MSHVKPQNSATERSSTALYAQVDAERQEERLIKKASDASRRHEFNTLRLAANDAVRRFQGIHIRGERNTQIRVTMTPLERLVTQEVFQRVMLSTGTALATKNYLRTTIGCDAKVVASALAKAIALGWLHCEGRDRYRPNFERVIEAQAKNPKWDSEDGKHPDLNGETPHKNGKNPALYKDSNSVTTLLSNSSVAGIETSERECNQIAAGLSFSEFWQAIGMSGKEGPARAAWGKLTVGEQKELSDLVAKHQRINIGNVWASVWLNTKAWRDFKPAQVQALALAPYPNAPDIQTREAWSAIRADLVREHGADGERYLGDADLRARVGDRVLLTVTGSYIKDRLDSSYRETLSRQFSIRLGVEIAVAIGLRAPTNDDR